MAKRPSTSNGRALSTKHGGAQFRSRATTPVQFNRWHGPRRRSAAAHTSSTMIVPVARPVQERERPVTAGVFEAKDRVYLRPTGRYDLVGLSHRERVLLRGKRTGQRPLPSLSEQPHVFSLPGPTHMLADNWRARGLMRGSASALNFPSLGLNGAPTRAPVLPCQSPLAVQAEARGCYQVGAPPDAHQRPAGQANPASRSCSALPLFQTSPLGRLSRTSLHHHSHDQARDLIHLAHEPRVSTPFLSASREAQITGLDGLLPGQLDTRPDSHGVRSSPDSFARCHTCPDDQAPLPRAYFTDYMNASVKSSSLMSVGSRREVAAARARSPAARK